MLCLYFLALCAFYYLLSMRKFGHHFLFLFLNAKLLCMAFGGYLRGDYCGVFTCLHGHQRSLLCLNYMVIFLFITLSTLLFSKPLSNLFWSRWAIFMPWYKALFLLLFYILVLLGVIYASGASLIVLLLTSINHSFWIFILLQIIITISQNDIPKKLHNGRWSNQDYLCLSCYIQFFLCYMVIFVERIATKFFFICISKL